MSPFFRVPAFSLAVAILSHTALSAQDCARGITIPAAGSWSEYRSSDGTMRLAILGNETRAGKSMVRMEMAMTSKDGPAIMQMLVPGYPYDMAQVQDLVFKTQGMPAMRVNEQMMSMMRGHMPKDVLAEACRSQQITRVGEESVTVPAGTFQTVHYRDAQSGNDVWVSTSVPFGMVKMHAPQSGDIVLTGKGTDAKSQITETPQDMPAMGMPRN